MRSVSFIAVCLLSVSCFAQQSPTPTWQSLFNGKDLTGWEILNAQHLVEVKDGMIVATTLLNMENGFLCTTQQYGDFILELEIKTDLLLDNTGIQFRSLSDPNRNGRVYGYQVQVENRPPHQSQWSGGIQDEAGRGFLYVLEDDPKRQKAYKQNQWNHIRLEAIGTSSRVWVNGIPTAHLIDDKIMKGMICLQLHGGTLVDERGEQRAYMRNVRMQTGNLKPSPYDEVPIANYIPNHLSEAEKSQGFELLFDGMSEKSWRGVADKSISANVWKIEGGQITIAPPADGTQQTVAMSEKQYGPFEMKFDFKIHGTEGIAGINFFSDGKVTTKRDALYGKFAIDNFKNLSKVTRNLWRDWNRGVIKASADGRVEFWLNNYKIQEYFRDPGQAPKGYIILDALGTDTVSYRSIKIRELKK